MEKIKYFPWESLIEILLNYVDIGIHIVDKNGNTLFYNKANSKLEGLNENEVIGKNILEIFPSLTPETSTLLKVLKTKEPIINKLQVFLTYKGKEVTTLNTTFPLFYSGELIGAIELSRDITEIKKLSETIINLQSKNKKNKLPKVIEKKINDFKTVDEDLKKILKKIEENANSIEPILIIGESGVGKKLISEIIHSISNRKDNDFLYQDCENVEESILEELIFNLLNIAENSTLYLSNIDKIPISLQEKINYYLEKNVINFKLITSMENLPIFSINNGKLKKEFYYNISKHEFYISPLRERKKDIILLFNDYSSYLEKKYGKEKKFSNEFKDFLLSYSFPGNVRELFYILEYSYLNSEDKIITLKDLPNLIYFKPFDLKNEIDNFEKKIISEVLYLTNFNVSKASKLLNLPRQTLQYKLRKLKVSEKRRKE